MKRKCAVYALQRDEVFHLPLWLRYYGSQFEPEDIYVLDHNSQLPEVRAALEGHQVTPVDNQVHNNEWYDIDWYVDVITTFRTQLFERYEYVLYTDVDEWVIPKHGSLRDFVAHADRDAYRCVGYEVIEGVMHAWGPDDKPNLTRVPLKWGHGIHTSIPEIKAKDDLFLYHLHRLSFAAAWAKRQRYQADPHRSYLYQEVVDEKRYRDLFDTNGTTHAEPYHERLRAALNQYREKR